MWLPSDQNGELELTDIVDLLITIYVVITYYAPTQLLRAVIIIPA